MKNEDIDMAYIAGIMDGDGSFSIIKLGAKCNPLYYPFLQFVSRHRVKIDFLSEKFGGNVNVRAPIKCKDGSMGASIFRWRMRSAHNVKPMLTKIIPFLKIKQDRAELLLKFINDLPFVRGQKMPVDKLVAKENFYIKIKDLNHATSFNNIIPTKVANGISTDPVFWSYMAGLMDTDGSFSIKKQVLNKGTHVVHPRYLPVISISMVDTRALNYLRENFNLGKLYIPKNKACTNGFHYQFGVYTKTECIEFLKRVIPFLKSKQKNAETLLFFCENSENTKYCRAGISKEELSFRDRCYQELINLNKYGVFKSSLMDLKPLPGHAEGNKGQGC